MIEIITGNSIKHAIIKNKKSIIPKIQNHPKNRMVFFFARICSQGEKVKFQKIKKSMQCKIKKNQNVETF
jgi:hypothetical protein